MDITYRLQGVTFEWDEEKARANVEKHGVTLKKQPKRSSIRSPRVATRLREMNAVTFSWDTR